MVEPGGGYPGSAMVQDSAPTLAPLDRGPSLNFGHLVTPSETSFMTTASATTGATNNFDARRGSVANDFSSRNTSVVDEFGSGPPSGPPSHMRAGASYDPDFNPPLPAVAAAATIGSRASPAPSGPRQGAGRFATFPVKGARPRNDSSGLLDENRLSRSDDLPPSPVGPPSKRASALGPYGPGHAKQASTSSFGSAQGSVEQPPVPPAAITEAHPPLPPKSPSAIDTTPRLPASSTLHFDQPPSLGLATANSPDSDFSSAIAAALSGGYSAPPGSPPNLQSGYAPPSGPPPPLQATPSNTGYQPTTYEPASYSRPAFGSSRIPPPPVLPLPPGAALPSPLSPPNKNYELPSPASITASPQGPSLPSISEAPAQALSQHPSPISNPTSPLSPNRRSWDAKQPTGPATTLPTPPVMPTLVERPTDESFVSMRSIATLRNEAPLSTAAVSGPLAVTIPSNGADHEDESELSYMSPSRHSRADSDLDKSVVFTSSYIEDNKTDTLESPEKSDRSDRRVRFGEVTVSGDEYEQDDDDNDEEAWMREADEDEEMNRTQGSRKRPSTPFIRE
jgi:hypothetical protein